MYDYYFSDRYDFLHPNTWAVLSFHLMPKNQIYYFRRLPFLFQLGITNLFSRDDSDLSGIAEDLFVSKAVQKAYINVDEKGSEAAAATGKLPCLFI